MPDRLYIDIHVPAQKMFRLRIVGATEHFLNKNLPAARCDEHPKERAQQATVSGKIRGAAGDSDKADYFLKSSAPFLRVYT